MPHLPSWNIQLNPGPLEGYMVLIHVVPPASNQ